MPPPANAESAAPRILPVDRRLGLRTCWCWAALPASRGRVPAKVPVVVQRLPVLRRIDQARPRRAPPTDFAARQVRTLVFPVTRSWSWEALVLALTSRNHFNDVHGWRQHLGFGGTYVPGRGCRAGKQRGLQHRRRIDLFRVDRIPQRKLGLAFRAGHGELRGVSRRDQQSDHRNRLRFAFAILLHLLASSQNTNIFQDRAPPLVTAPLTPPRT